MIKRSIPWARQPQIPVAIDQSNQFGKRLAFCAPLNPAVGLIDLVSNQFATKTGSLTPASNSEGLYPLFGTSNYLDFPTKPRGIGATTPCTIAWMQEARSTASYSTILNLQVGTPGSTPKFAILQSVSDANYYFTAGPQQTNGAHSWSVALGAVVNNRVDRFILTAVGGLTSLTASDWNLYRNGVLVSRGTSYTYASSTTDAFRVGDLGVAEHPWEGLIGELNIFTGAFSAQEVNLYNDNPRQIFASQQRNIYVSVASGSPTASQIESGAAVETSSIASATTAATAESCTTLETASVAAATTANITEAGTAVETTSADIGALSSSQVESGAAVETLSVVASTTAAQADAGAAAETSSVTFTTLSAIAETGSAVETSSATIAGQTITATTLVITKITGTFAAGSIKVGATTVGTCTGAQTINGASTALLRAQYTNLAADVYRALITTVPGSGSILGIWMHNDVKYAFRNVADGLSAAMYKNTTSGWLLVALGRELSYTSGGTYAIAVGDTITGETSAATAVITAITVESGTLAAGTAAGRIIFASQTGTFQTETIKVGANLNVANISGNSTAITFTVPGGRFEFVNYNFGSGSRMYGVDGKNRGFEFDGTTFVPISTGMVADTPSFVKGHKSHLFYAFAGSLQHSGIGTPYTWSIVSGAAELAMGDTITGMQLQAGAADSATMTVFTRNNIKTLYGSSASDWNLSSYKEEAGAYKYTNQQVGGTYMLDDRGITSLVTSQNFGNFEDATLTKKIQSWINARRSMSIASCIARDKNQYRLFFTDGSALFVTIDNGNPIGMMPILLTHPVTCICSLENSSGNEEIYFGSTDGYVYQMDIGTSMDGGDIEFYMNLAFNHLKSPRVLKSFKTAVLEVSGEGYGEFSLGYDLSYLSTEVVQPPTQATALSLNPLSYDSGATYDSGAVYDGVSLTPSVFHIGGDGENISLKILGSSDYGNPLRFSGALVDFIVRRRLR